MHRAGRSGSRPGWTPGVEGLVPPWLPPSLAHKEETGQLDGLEFFLLIRVEIPQAPALAHQREENTDTEERIAHWALVNNDSKGGPLAYSVFRGRLPYGPPVNLWELRDDFIEFGETQGILQTTRSVSITYIYPTQLFRSSLG